MTNPFELLTVFAKSTRTTAVQDADFRTWWATHLVTGTGHGAKHYRHPLVGDLTLDCDTWDSPDDSRQRLMILTAEPGTPSTSGCASSPPGTPNRTQAPGHGASLNGGYRSVTRTNA